MNREDTWEDMYYKSGRLQHPYSIDELLSEKEVIELEKVVIKIINKFLDRNQLHKGIKIYKNGQLRNDIIEKMDEMRPDIAESLEEWGIKIFEKDKYGIVFNSLEAYDNKITEIMGSVISPLIKKVGIPLGGISFLFFMGNYGFTPFGIHKEAKGEEGFLFHLGPAKKVFYTWDIEALNKIEHNTKVFHDELNEMLSSSKEHVLKSGSVMFIPHEVYHIAKTEEFSISIVMDYINPSRDYLEQELAKEISIQEYPKNISGTFLNPIQVNDDNKGSENSLDFQSIMKKYQNAFDKRVAMLKSNGGILQPSIKNYKLKIPNGAFNLKGKNAFPICIHQPDKDDTIIFASGNEIKKKPNPNLNLIISQLNTGKILSFQSMKELLRPQWDLVEIYSFISDLVVTESIEIIEKK